MIHQAHRRRRLTYVQEIDHGRTQKGGDNNMGNNYAGKAMGQTAEILLRNRLDKTALTLLDEICDRWCGCNADFKSECHIRPEHLHPDYDDYTIPGAPLGNLIAEAFGTANRNYVVEYKEGGKKWLEKEWWQGPYKKFRKRYEFH